MYYFIHINSVKNIIQKPKLYVKLHFFVFNLRCLKECGWSKVSLNKWCNSWGFESLWRIFLVQFLHILYAKICVLYVLTYTSVCYLFYHLYATISRYFAFMMRIQRDKALKRVSPYIAFPCIKLAYLEWQCIIVLRWNCEWLIKSVIVYLML